MESGPSAGVRRRALPASGRVPRSPGVRRLAELGVLFLVLLAVVAIAAVPTSPEAQNQKLPFLVPELEPAAGTICDPCEGLPVITTAISSMIPANWSYGPSEVIPLEAGCYKQDLTFLPLSKPTPDPLRYPPIILLGAGPDKTIIVGQGTQSAVIRFLTREAGGFTYGGGEVRGLKIKPAYGQDGIYFENGWGAFPSPTPLPTATPTYLGTPVVPMQMIVQNVIIDRGRRGVVVNGPGEAKIANSTLANGTEHAITLLNGATAVATNNLIVWYAGSAFYPNGSPVYVDATYDAIWSNGNNNSGDLPQGNHNLFVDPKIWNTCTFRLEPTSPLIGAGLMQIPMITPLPMLPGPTPTPAFVPVDIGAYGKADFVAPVPATMVQASRQLPRIDVDWIDAADNVAVGWYAFYTAPDAGGVPGNWMFNHSAVGGIIMDPKAAGMLNVPTDPTPFPTPAGTPTPGPTPAPLLWTKMRAFDTSWNASADANAVAPPTEPVPYQWSIYRDSGHCVSTWDVKMRFNPGSVPHAGGAIDQYEIWHCWRANGQNCDKVGYVTSPTADNIYAMHVPCDTKNHYYMFRGREKVGPPPTNGRHSYSRYRTYSTLGSQVRICMLYPETCTDCANPPCASSGDTSPCPDGGICPPVTTYPAPEGPLQDGLAPDSGLAPLYGEIVVNVPDPGGTIYSRPDPESTLAAPRLTLHGALPNPASPRLAIGFVLSSWMPATLSLYDLGGRRIVKRSLGGLGPGRHLVSLGEETAIPPGVYLARLQQGSNAETKKVLVLAEQ
jgi:hypothetical protein